MKQIVHTELAPQPIGSYTQANYVGNTLYLSGQIGIDPTLKQLAGDSFEAQLNQVFLNLTSVLQAAGADLYHVVKITVYLRNFSEDYPKLDSIMNNYFNAPYPARTTIGVSALPKDALVEIDAIAVMDE